MSSRGYGRGGHRGGHYSRGQGQDRGNDPTQTPPPNNGPSSSSSSSQAPAPSQSSSQDVRDSQEGRGRDPRESRDGREGRDSARQPRHPRGPNPPPSVQPPSSTANSLPTHLQPPPTPSSSAPPSIHPECLICCSPILHHTISSCPHSLQICATCSLRLKLFVKRKKKGEGGTEEEKKATEDVKGGQPWECPFCRQRWAQVLFTREMRSEEDHTQALALQSTDISSYLYDESIDTFFQDVKTQSQFLKLRSIYCPLCETSPPTSTPDDPRPIRGPTKFFSSMANLNRHLQNVHNKFTCEACVTTRQVFIHEHEFFSQSQLLSHFQHGSPATAAHGPIDPHPFCQFCHQPFFSSDELYAHLSNQHRTCRFCLSEDMEVLTDRGFMSRAEVFAACPELAPPSPTPAPASDNDPLPFGGALLSSKASPMHWTPSAAEAEADAAAGIRYEPLKSTRAASAVVLRDSLDRYGRQCGLCSARVWSTSATGHTWQLGDHNRRLHADEMAATAAARSGGRTSVSAASTARYPLITHPLQEGSGTVGRVSPQIKRPLVSHARGDDMDDDDVKLNEVIDLTSEAEEEEVKMDDEGFAIPLPVTRPPLSRPSSMPVGHVAVVSTPPSTTRSLRSSSSAESPSPSASSSNERSRSSTTFHFTPHGRAISATSSDSMDDAFATAMGESIEAAERRAAAEADVTGAAMSDEEDEMEVEEVAAAATSSSPLLFASLDPSTGHLVYLPATALTWQTVTSMVEFTSAAEAPHWAADADEYGLTPAEAERMQARSDRARLGQLLDEGDKFHAEHLSNGVSLVVSRQHDMFVRVGLTRLRAGDAHTIWAPSDYHKVKAGALLSDDIRQRVKMTGQAVAGIAASAGADADELPFAAVLELKTEAEVEAFLLLYGYWLGDGSLHARNRRVVFSPKKPGDKTWLLARLEELGLTVRNGDVTMSGVDKANGQRDVYIRNGEWVEYFFEEYGPKYGVPSPTSSMVLSAAGLTSTHTGLTQPRVKSVKWFWMWVWRLRKERARVLLTGLRFADGCEATDVNAIYTSGYRFRDDLARLALHAGYSVRTELWYKRGDHRGYCATGEAYGARHDAWAVAYSDDNRGAAPVLRNHSDIKDVAVPGGVQVQVWCPTVPPHNLIITRRVRKNADNVITQASKPVVVGNCQSDGSQKWYRNDTALRRHFATKHFLCDQGDCLHKPPDYAAFRDDISLRAHQIAAHVDKGSLSQAQLRQMARVDLSVGFFDNRLPEGRGGGDGGGGGGGRRGRRGEEEVKGSGRDGPSYVVDDEDGGEEEYPMLQPSATSAIEQRARLANDNIVERGKAEKREQQRGGGGGTRGGHDSHPTPSSTSSSSVSMQRSYSQPMGLPVDASIRRSSPLSHPPPPRPLCLPVSSPLPVPSSPLPPKTSPPSNPLSAVTRNSAR